MRARQTNPLSLKRGGDTLLHHALRVAKSRKKGTTAFFIWLAMAGFYMCMVGNNLERQSRLLSNHEMMMYEVDDETRGLITKDLGSGLCDIGHPTMDANPAPPDATRTLLASYPGSGKRFTWTVIKALTNTEVADDWNFSDKLNQNPLTIKTSWPHKEGKWSWGSQMDQVILLIRNPRWAIPSYHNMRWELDYARDWPSSYARILDTYTERPDVTQWENWRDGRAKIEADRWYDFLNFWMQGGFQEWRNDTHPRCLYSDIDCHPRAVVEFDHFYQENPTSDYWKITDVLDSSANVEVIAAKARACVLDGVYGRKELHQGGRPFPDRPPQFRFTVPQFERLLNRTTTLITDFSEDPLNNETEYPHAAEFVSILEGYNVDNFAEYQQEMITFLEEFVLDRYGTEECETLPDELDRTTCAFIKNKENHDTLTDMYYPDDFPHEDWLDVSEHACVYLDTLPFIRFFHFS